MSMSTNYFHHLFWVLIWNEPNQIHVYAPCLFHVSRSEWRGPGGMQEAVFSFLQTLGDPQELHVFSWSYSKSVSGRNFCVTFFLCQDSVVVLLDDAWCKVQGDLPVQLVGVIFRWAQPWYCFKLFLDDFVIRRRSLSNCSCTQEAYSSLPVDGEFVSKVLPDACTFPARRVVFFLGLLADLWKQKGWNLKAVEVSVVTISFCWSKHRLPFWFISHKIGCRFKVVHAACCPQLECRHHTSVGNWHHELFQMEYDFELCFWPHFLLICLVIKVSAQDIAKITQDVWDRALGWVCFRCLKLFSWGRQGPRGCNCLGSRESKLADP